MGWLSSERPPKQWSPGYFKEFVERLRTALNFLDVSNFPNGVPNIGASGTFTTADSKTVTVVNGIIITIE